MKVCPCLTLILGKNLLRYTWVCKLKLSTFRILNYVPWIFPLTQPELTLTGSKVGWICIQIIFTGPSLDMSVVDQGGTNSTSTKFSKTILLMEIYVILVDIHASWVTQLVQITRNTFFFPGPKIKSLYMRSLFGVLVYLKLWVCWASCWIIDGYQMWKFKVETGLAYLSSVCQKWPKFSPGGQVWKSLRSSLWL